MGTRGVKDPILLASVSEKRKNFLKIHFYVLWNGALCSDVPVRCKIENILQKKLSEILEKSI